MFSCAKGGLQHRQRHEPCAAAVKRQQWPTDPSYHVGRVGVRTRAYTCMQVKIHTAVFTEIIACVSLFRTNDLPIEHLMALFRICICVDELR